MRHIALMGRARSGKDTVASHLVGKHGYQRVAFGDRHKAAALDANPIIGVDDGRPVSLREAVEAHGWEYVKDNYPEARRFLIDFGMAMREVDPQVWVRPVLTSLRLHTYYGVPCVGSDVRFANEAEAFADAGALFVRVVRRNSGLGGSAAAHPSETELNNYAADVVLTNDGSVSDLLKQVEGLVR